MSNLAERCTWIKKPSLSRLGAIRERLDRDDVQPNDLTLTVGELQDIGRIWYAAGSILVPAVCRELRECLSELTIEDWPTVRPKLMDVIERLRLSISLVSIHGLEITRWVVPQIRSLRKACGIEGHWRLDTQNGTHYKNSSKRLIQYLADWEVPEQDNVGDMYMNSLEKKRGVAASGELFDSPEKMDEHAVGRFVKENNLLRHFAAYLYKRCADSDASSRNQFAKLGNLFHLMWVLGKTLQIKQMTNELKDHMVYLCSLHETLVARFYADDPSQALDQISQGQVFKYLVTSIVAFAEDPDNDDVRSVVELFNAQHLVQLAENDRNASRKLLEAEALLVLYEKKLPMAQDSADAFLAFVRQLADEDEIPPRGRDLIKQLVDSVFDVSTVTLPDVLNQPDLDDRKALIEAVESVRDQVAAISLTDPEVHDQEFSGAYLADLKECRKLLGRIMLSGESASKFDLDMARRVSEQVDAIIPKLNSLQASMIKEGLSVLRHATNSASTDEDLSDIAFGVVCLNRFVDTIFKYRIHNREYMAKFDSVMGHFRQRPITQVDSNHDHTSQLLLGNIQAALAQKCDPVSYDIHVFLAVVEFARHQTPIRHSLVDHVDGLLNSNSDEERETYLAALPELLRIRPSTSPEDPKTEETIAPESEGEDLVVEHTDSSKPANSGPAEVNEATGGYLGYAGAGEEISAQPDETYGPVDPVELGSAAKAPPAVSSDLLQRELRKHIRILERINVDVKRGTSSEDQVNDLKRTFHTLKGIHASDYPQVARLWHRIESLIARSQFEYVEANFLGEICDAAAIMLGDLTAGYPYQEVLTLADGTEEKIDQYLALGIPPQSEEVFEEQTNTDSAGESGYVPRKVEEPAAPEQHQSIETGAVVGEYAFRLGQLSFDRTVEKAETVNTSSVHIPLDEFRGMNLMLQAVEQDHLVLTSIAELAALRSGALKESFDQLRADTKVIEEILNSSKAFKEQLPAASRVELEAAEASIRLSLSNAAGHIDELLASGESAKNAAMGSASIKSYRRRITAAALMGADELIPGLENRVRHTAKAVGKSVSLTVDTGDVALPAGMLSDLDSVLVHLMRNAIDHGIEKPGDRRAKGKPDAGHVSVRMWHDGVSTFVEFSDDGAGVDIEKMALKYELDEKQAQDPAVILGLMMEADVTTRDEVTDVSGRGVGLAVLRQFLDQHGASCELQFNASGTSFRIEIPSDDRFIPIVTVHDGGEVYGIPVNLIEQIREAGESNAEGVRLSAIVGSSGALEDQHTDFLIDIKEADAPIRIQRIGKKYSVLVKSLGGRVPGVTGTFMDDFSSCVPVLNHIALKNTESVVMESGAEPLPLALVVDDSIVSREWMVQAFGQLGYDVLTANDGVAAMDLVRLYGSAIRVISIDVEMPRLNGFELLAGLRRDPALEDTRLVMVTSQSGDAFRKRSKRLKADGFVTKPCSVSSLQEALRVRQSEGRAVLC